MLIVLGPTRWSHDLNLLVPSLSRASSVSLQNSAQGIRIGSQTNRNASNPFDVIYHPGTGHSSGNSRDESSLPKNVSTSTPYQSASYLQIERDIHAGQSPVKATGFARQLRNLPPVVTVIDDEQLKRGNLVVSRLASLRHRNLIRRRNKMVRKHDLDAEKSPSVFSVASSTKKKRKSKLSFVFPIKRRTSFKYTPVSLLPSQRFRLQKDVDDYFVYNNIAALMKDVIPRTMMTYDYSQLIKIEPNLKLHPKRFAISRASDFTILQTPQMSAPRNFVPLQGEKVSARDHRLPHRQVIPKPPSETVSEVEKRKLFVATVYGQYKDQVFAGRHRIPPRLDQVMPFEADMLAPEEKVAIETKLALEVLLRRTLAAKIDYRLRKSGVPRLADLSSSDQSAGLTSGDQSSSSSDSANDKSKGYKRKNPRSPKDKSSKSRDTESFDTEEFMRSSLLSEMLPSPQVSFALKIFEGQLHQISVRDLDPKKQSGSKIFSGDSKKSGSPNMSIPMHLTPKEHEFSYTPKTHMTSSSVYSGDRFSRPESIKTALAISEMFVNDFNKFYYESERKKAEGDHNNLSNINLYSFQPLNRSNATLSTSSEPSAALNVETAPLSDSSNFANKLADPDSLSYTSSYPREKSHSKSTTDTSVIHSLDNLADSVHEYLLSEGGLDRDVNSPLRSEVSPAKMTSSSVYTDSVNQSGLDVTYGVPTPQESISPHNAISSHQHYSIESIVHNLQKEREYDQGLLTISYSASPKTAEHDIRSVNKELMSFQGSVHGGQTEASYSRHSNSGSDESSIAPLRTIRSTVENDITFVDLK